MDGLGWLGIFIAVLGAGMIVWGLSQRSKANALVSAARHWPTAPGIITSAQIVRGGTVRTPTFAPVVRYDYEVGGRRYSGERLRPGYVKVGSNAAAERMLQRYPVNQAVPVRYDPAHPGSSVLELETSSSPLITSAAGAVLLLLGGGIVVAAIAGVFDDGGGRSSRSRASSDYERRRDDDRTADRRDRYDEREPARERGEGAGNARSAQLPAGDNDNSIITMAWLSTGTWRLSCADRSGYFRFVPQGGLSGTFQSQGGSGQYRLAWGTPPTITMTANGSSISGDLVRVDRETMVLRLGAAPRTLSRCPS